MKSLLEFTKMTPAQRANGLKTLVTKSSTAKKEIVKILIAAEESGDFGKGKGEMNEYAVRITGVELRREAQGTYEACNVMRGIRAGTLAVTEAEFDSKAFGSFPLIMLSGFMGKSPEKVGEALEIIRSGLDVTKRLQALRNGEKKPKAKEKDSKESTDGASAAPEIQTPDPKGTTYFVPHDLVILNHEELMADIVAEIKGSPTIQDCENLLNIIGQLRAITESRREALEFEALEKAEAVAA